MTHNRILLLQNELEQNQAFFIKSPSNRYYLTGFNSSAGTVLITKNEALFFTDFRYFEKAKSQVCSCNTLLLSQGDKDIYTALKQQGITEILLETDYISLNEYKRLSDLFESIKISRSNALDLKLNQMRAVKSLQELEFIKQAQALTDKGFDYILNRISIGKTERQIALDLEFFMRNQGADGISFDFIVVSGKNSSLPHGTPTDKPIKNGDFVTLDFGVRLNGYCSDMTRTVAVGSASDQQRQLYSTVLSAQLAALKGVKSGIGCGATDKLARDIIYNAGYSGCFGHSLGHGVGIDIHEAPNLSPNSTAVLSTGNVVTVEPGIYIENRFGCRIEDLVYVTDSGIINLTKSPKELIIL